MSWIIEWLLSALKEIDATPVRAAVRIVEAADRLADDPRPAVCKELKGHADLWRIRIGSYRSSASLATPSDWSASKRHPTGRTRTAAALIA
jgi:hypothetical protein